MVSGPTLVPTTFLLTRLAQYWKNKLKHKKTIEFPSKLCEAIAGITQDFSFAYLKEAFVATLLDLARAHDDMDDDELAGSVFDGEDDPLDKYEFWRSFKAQVKILRDEMGDGSESSATSRRSAYHEGFSTSPYDEVLPMLENVRLQGDPHLETASRQGTVDAAAIGQHAQSSRSGGPPDRTFAPLARNKSAKLDANAWELGL